MTEQLLFLHKRRCGNQITVFENKFFYFWSVCKNGYGRVAQRWSRAFIRPRLWVRIPPLLQNKTIRLCWVVLFLQGRGIRIGVGRRALSPPCRKLFKTEGFERVSKLLRDEVRFPPLLQNKTIRLRWVVFLQGRGIRIGVGSAGGR